MACAFAVYAIENVGHEIEGEYTARPPIAARSPQAKAPSAAFYCFATPVWRCHNLSMCGRYRLSRRKQLVEEYFESASEEEDWSPRYNIAPTQPVATVRQEGSSRILSMMRWGLVPSWATDIKIGNQLINGRSETVLEKPAFRDSFRTRRCLIPADGFYEWKKSGKQRQPFHFGMKDNSLFAFAGVWDRWKAPAGPMLQSCSILTTAPNELLDGVHDRMPVILPRRHYETWLTAPAAEVERLAELLVPFDAGLMSRYPVSSLVNKPENDTPECALEVPEPEAQTHLW
jgi:putative SOS response-associated peptidase YedK